MTIAANITQIRMTGLSSQVGGSTLTFDTTNKTIMYTASSERYKKDITDINNVYSVGDIVNQLRPVSFKWKTNDIQDFGLIAEEVEPILKDLVCYNPEGTPETVSYHKLPVLLLKYCKDMSANFTQQISQLTQRIQELEQTQ
jgi:hypothetical protein